MQQRGYCILFALPLRTPLWQYSQPETKLPHHHHFATSKALTSDVRTLALLIGTEYPEPLTMLAPAQPGYFTATLRNELRSKAASAAANSYSPYSRFRVGAALLLTDGTVVTGCNVENCSFRLTSCAEQAAIARAVSEFGPEIRLRAVAIANLNHAASMPCGACRQTLSEFGGDDTIILYPGPSGSEEETTLGKLFPDAFRPDFLESK